MTHDVALIGAGAMGGAIGARLLQTGTRLAVFDLDPEKVAALLTEGATAAPTASAAAQGLGRSSSVSMPRGLSGSPSLV